MSFHKSLIFVCLVMLNDPVNSYNGHVGTVSSHNHIFYRVVNQCLVNILSLVTDYICLCVNIKHKTFGYHTQKSGEAFFENFLSACR